MGLAGRIRFLEAGDADEWLRREVQRIAIKCGVDPEAALREAEEIKKIGVDEARRRLARDFGLSEDEVRAATEAMMRELEDE